MNKDTLYQALLSIPSSPEDELHTTLGILRDLLTDLELPVHAGHLTRHILLLQSPRYANLITPDVITLTYNPRPVYPPYRDPYRYCHLYMSYRVDQDRRRHTCLDGYSTYQMDFELTWSLRTLRYLRRDDDTGPHFPHHPTYCEDLDNAVKNELELSATLRAFAV